MTARLQDSAVAELITALGPTFWLQWGLGSGAPSSATGVTGTGTEARTAATVSSTTRSLTITGGIVSIASGMRNITEVGVFDNAGLGAPPSGGHMIAYADFAAIQIYAIGMGIQFSITIQF